MTEVVSPIERESQDNKSTERERDSSTTSTERIKQIGLKSGAVVVGVADVEAFNEYIPEGHRPQDILPNAKSVVVAGGTGPTAGAWRTPDHRIMEITGYDFRENVAIHVMCDYIERTYNHQAIQAPSLSTSGHHPPMSMMLAAVLAGLGTRSLAANIILNDEYGMLYYAALLTTMRLEPDQRLEKDACPDPMCVKTYQTLGKTPCMAACPADDGGCLDGSLDEDGRIESSHYNRERCVTRAQNFGIGGFQKGITDIVNEEDTDTQKSMIYSDFFTQSLSALSFYKESVAQCFECIRVCPLGRQKRKLK